MDAFEKLLFSHGEERWSIVFERVPHYIDINEFYVIIVKKAGDQHTDLPVILSKVETEKIYKKVRKLKKDQDCEYEKFVSIVVNLMIPCLNRC